MYKLSLLFAACAALAPFVQAETVAEVCGASTSGAFCSRNGTTLFNCATKSESKCGAQEFCQTQGPKIARCEPITRDADQVCQAAASQGLKSAIRCSNDVANVRVSCPNALISRCPSGKVCVQANSRYARCETPAFTTEYTVVETFVADVEPLPISHEIPVTATTFLPSTTTIALTETIVTTPEVATTTLGINTDSGFPTTLPLIQTTVVPIHRTVVGLTTIVMPTTVVHSDMSTILQTVEVTQTIPVEPTEIPVITPIQTITNTLTQTVTKPRTRTQLLSTTLGFITEVETISMSSTLVNFPTLETTPLMTLTETVVNTPTFTVAPTVIPDLTLTVTETNQVIPTITETETPYVTMTSTEVPPTVQTIIDVSTQTAVYPSVIIVPTTDMFTYSATQNVVQILPTTVVDPFTPILQATPLVTVPETNAVTFTPTFTAVLPTSEVMTYLYTSAVPGTSIASETAVETNVATWTNMATIVSEATSTAFVPMSTLIPTIATDTFIVCHTPVPTFSQGIPQTYGLTLTASPVPVTASPIVTRTRGPNVERTQTTVIAGLPTVSSNSESGDSIPIFGAFSRYAAHGQAAAIKVEGACTTSYRVKFGYSTAPVTATDLHTYPVSTVHTNVAHETAMSTSVAYQTNMITAETLPITVPYTSSLGVFTTMYPEAPTHTLDVIDVAVPTVIEYTAEPVGVTQVGHFTTTMAYPTQFMYPIVNTYTQSEHVTEVSKSTLIEVLPIKTAEPEPATTAFVTEIPTFTETLPALTTYLPTVTSTMPAPTTARVTTSVVQKPVTSVAPYITKVTKVMTDIGVQTQTSILASPTVISTVNVFPPIVQVTVTATATADEAEETTQVQTLTRVASATLSAQTTSAAITRVHSTTNYATNVYTATSTQVHASTYLSTRTFDAVPTGNLAVHPARLQKTNVAVIDVSTNTVVIKQQPPVTQMSSVVSTSTGVVTVTSVVGAQATGGPAIADASASSSSVPVLNASDAGSATANATTTIQQVSTVTATSTLAAPEPTFTIMPFPGPAPTESSSTVSAQCPSQFTLGNNQYQVTAAGTEADGEAACAALGQGWQLADVSDAAEHEGLGNMVCAATYYRSWLNNDYGDACLTMYPGGATVVPSDGCTGLYPALCKLEA